MGHTNPKKVKATPSLSFRVESIAEILMVNVAAIGIPMILDFHT